MGRNLFVFVAVWVAVVVGMVAFAGVGAPGAKAVLVLAGSMVAAVAGLYVVAPDAFDYRRDRVIAVELFAIGLSLVFAYRIVFAVVRVAARPDQSYSVWEWLASTAAFTALVFAASAAVVSVRRVQRVRAVMGSFAVTGLAFALAAEATRILHLGFTAGRWGLVPVAASFAFYPVLAVPFHAVAAAILGWGWARTTLEQKPLFAAFGYAIALVLTTVFNKAVVRDPFAGIPVLLVALGVWAWLFKQSGRGRPIVARPHGPA